MHFEQHNSKGLRCALHSGGVLLAVLSCKPFQAWRFLLQLRWVRRRVDEARLRGCKGAASRVDVQQQDRSEAAAVAAAAAATATGHSSGTGARDGGGGGGDAGGSWLSGRQELLLLQEMGQLLGRWLQHVMDRLVRNGWAIFEQARAGVCVCGVLKGGGTGGSSSSKCSHGWVPDAGTT